MDFSPAEAADEFWAAFLGCETEFLDAGRTVVVPRPSAKDAGETLFLFRKGTGCVASVMSHEPARLVHAMMKLVGDRPPAEVFDKALLRFGFGSEYPTINGPIAVGLFDAEAPQEEAPDSSVRPLNSKARADSEALRRLFGSTDIADWERGGVEFDHPVIFGAFESETLVAVASAVPWSARLEGVAVFTHPGHRRHGWGRRVTRALCRHVTAQGHAVQMAAPEGDTAALGLARALGFHDYAETISVVFPR
ncbi:MAG: hypothetical protein PWP23_565 [Candidatus Sumerlaeota bacterium]|nr:hypothetical protein [Candidatus Sumerlaeota bacterium]